MRASTLAVAQSGLDLGKTADHRAGLAGHRQRIERGADQQAVGFIGQIA